MSGLSHLDAQGQAHMVDVGDKAETSRMAIAEGCVVMQPQTLAIVRAGDAKKGDVLGTARLALFDEAQQLRMGVCKVQVRMSSGLTATAATVGGELAGEGSP